MTNYDHLHVVHIIDTQYNSIQYNTIQYITILFSLSNHMKISRQISFEIDLHDLHTSTNMISGKNLIACESYHSQFVKDKSLVVLSNDWLCQIMFISFMYK